jgi:site-specific DNA-cytosine methylase
LFVGAIVVIQRWWRRARHTIPVLLAMITKGTALKKVVAAKKLDGMARDSDDNRVAIGQATGAIAALVVQVGDDTSAQTWAAAYALQALAWSAVNRVPIIQALMGLASHGTHSQRQNAGDALGAVAEVDDALAGVIAEVDHKMLKAAAAKKQAETDAAEKAVEASKKEAEAKATKKAAEAKVEAAKKAVEKEAQAVAAKKQAAGKAPAMCNVQSKKAIKKVHLVVWGKAEKAAKGKAKEQAKKAKARAAKEKEGAAAAPRIHRATVPLALETDPLGCMSQAYEINNCRVYCVECGLECNEEDSKEASPVCDVCGAKIAKGEEPCRMRTTVASAFAGSCSALHPWCEQVARGPMPPFDNAWECELDDDHETVLKLLAKDPVYEQVRSNTRHRDFHKMPLEAIPTTDVLIMTPPCIKFTKAYNGTKDKDGNRIKMGLLDHDVRRWIKKCGRMCQLHKFKVAFGEEVEGFFFGPHDAAWKELKYAAEEAGYTVVLREIDIANLEMPMSRHRYFFAFIRNDVGWSLTEFEQNMKVLVRAEREAHFELDQTQIKSKAQMRKFLVSKWQQAESAKGVGALNPREKALVQGIQKTLAEKKRTRQASQEVQKQG